MTAARALALAVVVMIAGCGQSSSSTTVVSTVTVATTASPATVTMTVTTSPPPATTVASAPPDGRRFGYIREVADSGTARTIAFDEARFLTGAAANAACTAAGDPECPPPNDYYIVNASHAVRRYDVSARARVTTVFDPCCEPTKGSLEALTEASGTDDSPYLLESSSYWITIRGGLVVKIEQQYLP